jgi:membrane-bound serine protease (ClpP class)
LSPRGEAEQYNPAMGARRVLSLSCMVAGWLLLEAGRALAQTPEGAVVVGHIDGIINPVMAGYVSRVIDQAEAQRAPAVVFTMDTPGGLSDAMRDIDQRILRSTVPVVVYVAPDGARAGSAGVYISYAAHLLGMAPATNIGSATPVAMGDNGQEAQMSDEMKAKVTNDAAAGIRALAERRGRNADWAEEAVRKGANLQASEALNQHVANYVATDLNDLLHQMDGATVQTAAGAVTLRTAGAPTQDVGMSPIESFLLTITNPTIAYILLSLGSLGLLLELYNPGSVFPGVIGGICLLLAFYALGTLPLNFAGVALILFGLLLFGLEPFLPTHGILAFGGAIAFVAGSLLLINVAPGDGVLEVSRGAVAAVSAIFLGLLALVVTAAVRARRRRPVTGREGLIGAPGVARTDLSADTPGMVLTQGELWQAVTGGAPIRQGTRVEVESLDGLLLTVRPAAARPAKPAVAPAAAAAPQGPQAVAPDRLSA